MRGVAIRVDDPNDSHGGVVLGTWVVMVVTAWGKYRYNQVCLSVANLHGSPCGSLFTPLDAKYRSSSIKVKILEISK
jgi:hypothetical protein